MRHNLSPLDILLPLSACLPVGKAAKHGHGSDLDAQIYRMHHTPAPSAGQDSATTSLRLLLPAKMAGVLMPAKAAGMLPRQVRQGHSAAWSGRASPESCSTERRVQPSIAIKTRGDRGGLIPAEHGRPYPGPAENPRARPGK